MAAATSHPHEPGRGHEEAKPLGGKSPQQTHHHHHHEEASIIFASQTYKTQHWMSALPSQTKYFREAVPVDFFGPPPLFKEKITCHKSLRFRLRDLERANINNDQIFLFFLGTPDKNGRSWHAESNTVERAVSFMLKKLQIGGFFLQVHVGSRLEWMDADNAFKKDPKIELTTIPTLWVWGSHKRISGKRCNDVESLYMLLKD